MKKLLRAGFIGILLILMASSAFAAGTVTQTISRMTKFSERDNDVYTVTLAWTAGAGGGVTAVPISGPITEQMQGRYIIQVLIVPGSGGAAPTTLYDITLLDPNGIDVMGGALGDRSATATEVARPLPDPTKYSGLITGVLTFTLTNNTNASATGTAILFIQR